jgi:DNA-directed RNA polymerase
VGNELLTGSVLEEQIQLEEDAIARGVARYRKLAQEAIDRGEAAGLKPVERMMIHWLPALEEIINKEKRAIKRGDPGKGRAQYGPVMLALDTPRLAVIALHQMIGNCMADPNGPLLPRLSYAVGAAVIAEIHMDMMKKDDRASLRDLDRRFKRLNPRRVNWWAKRTLTDSLWNRKVCIQLGTRLAWCVIETASCRPYTEDFKLAFHHEKQWRDNQKKGVIRMDDEVFAAIEEGHLFRQSLRPRYLPMLVEPYKWGEIDGKVVEGGYVRIRTPFFSKPTPDQEKALAEHNVQPAYDTLNAVSSQDWTINDKALEVMWSIWHSGGNAAGVPSRDNLPLPPKPDNIERDATALKAWKSEAHEVHGTNAKLKAHRVEFLQKVGLARNLVGKKFWLPHQFDYRYRVYGIPLYLTPSGDDTARTLLLCGTRTKISDEGRDWLEIQVANCFGFDKASMAERRQWTHDHMDWIERTWRDPLGTDWWLQAEDPMQFWSAAAALFDPDLSDRIMCSSDGSQNGLQHLNAAGRCEQGGKQVNLIPGSRPSDLYTTVANVVIEVVIADAEAGNQVAQILLPILTRPGVARKILKRPVMTYCYGVTMVGARNQIIEELKRHGVPKKKLYHAGKYLAGHTMDSIGVVCVKAEEIFRWLEDCARRMCKHAPTQTIQWTTPSGLPVVQPYRNFGKTVIQTCLQRITVAYMQDDVPVSARRQIAGMVPNWVHSLDSCHMGRTAKRMKAMGLPFGSVHDSFWTHPNHMATLNKVIREEFVGMHDQPLLDNLRNEWLAMHPGLDLPRRPRYGELDINEVLKSNYFFH